MSPSSHLRPYENLVLLSSHIPLSSPSPYLVFLHTPHIAHYSFLLYLVISPHAFLHILILSHFFYLSFLVLYLYIFSTPSLHSSYHFYTYSFSCPLSSLSIVYSTLRLFILLNKKKFVHFSSPHPFPHLPRISLIPPLTFPYLIYFHSLPISPHPTLVYLPKLFLRGND